MGLLKGTTKSRQDWGVFLCYHPDTIRKRIEKGMSPQDALKIIDHTSPNYKIQYRQLLAA